MRRRWIGEYSGSRKACGTETERHRATIATAGDDGTEEKREFALRASPPGCIMQCRQGGWQPSVEAPIGTATIEAGSAGRKERTAAEGTGEQPRVQASAAEAPCVQDQESSCTMPLYMVRSTRANIESSMTISEGMVQIATDCDLV